MNKDKNFTTKHLQLNQSYVLEVVILLMAYPKKCMFQIKQRI